MTAFFRVMTGLPQWVLRHLSQTVYGVREDAPCLVWPHAEVSPLAYWYHPAQVW